MDLDEFYIAGINYKKSDIFVRGSFAVNSFQYTSILQKASLQNINELFVLSTCNRTEIYGIAAHSDILINLLCAETEGSEAGFKQIAYIKKGMQAVEHLFAVAAGLDSQILGDYEIVGQIKKAVKFSANHGFIGTFLSRLTNSILQASKEIKNRTLLSEGTVSVSFAAIQYLKENIKNIRDKKIAIFGTGKIGSNTCKNLVDYLDASNITLINRTKAKAVELAAELNLKVEFYTNYQAVINASDIIIVATNAESPFIKKEMLESSGAKVLIDLSVPNNIESSVKELSEVTLVNVDDLSKINDQTLQKRIQEVPKAKSIIASHLHEFIEWYNMRRFVPVLKAVKQKLMDMQQCSFFVATPLSLQTHNKQNIQKVINSMAVKMRHQHQPGCNYIEAINDFISSVN